MTPELAKQKIIDLCNVSDITIHRLEDYASLLVDWNPKINLVSKSTIPDMWERHFLDSAQVWPLIPQDAKQLVDIGSGAGFAGLVLAAIGAERASELKVTLIESDTRKCAFMRNAARKMGISVDIVTKRIESVENIKANVLTARALASVDDLLGHSSHILASDGVCLFLKGEACAIELEQARDSWNFDAELIPSVTHPSGVVAKLSGIVRV